jgi:hypothetical protein
VTYARIATILLLAASQASAGDFVTNPSATLPANTRGTKSNVRALPGGADPTKYIQAQDYNEHSTRLDSANEALYDLRNAIDGVGPGDLSPAKSLATGANTSRTMAARFADEVNVRDFGALANGTDDAPRIQAAINYAVSSGKRAIYIPPGTYTIRSSLNMTGITGLTIRGAGSGWYNCTKIYAAFTTPRPVFDMAGSNNFRVRGIIIWGDQTSPPSTAMLMSRVAGMGGAGVHVFEDVQANGWFTIASVISLSSEVNKYFGCGFQNSRAGGHAFWAANDNDPGAVSDFVTIPATQSGGNTLFTFVGTGFNAFGGTGTEVSVKGTFTNATWDSCYTNATNGLAAFQFTHGVSNSVILGHRDESSNAQNWLRFEGNVAHFTVIGSKASAGIYGLDGVTVSRLTVLSSELSWNALDPPGPYTVNVDILKYSLIDAHNNVKVRTQVRGGQFLSAGEAMTSGAQISLPTDTRGLIYAKERTKNNYAAGTSNPIVEWNIGSDFATHLVVPRVEAKKFATVVQPFVSSTLSPTPGLLDPVNLDLGSYVSVLLDQNLTIRNPNYGANAGGSDDGVRLTFVLTQDAVGGRTVTWPLASLQPPAAFKVDPTANATTTITFIADTKANAWRAESWTVMRAAARADAPTYTGNPAVLTDAATKTDLNALGTIVNDLLAKLRTAGLVAP